MDNGNDTSNRSGNFLNVYDAVWSIAFVLDKSRDELLKQGKVLENVTYGDTNATSVFRSKAKELDFATPNTGVRKLARYTIPNKSRKLLKDHFTTNRSTENATATHYTATQKLSLEWSNTHPASNVRATVVDRNVYLWRVPCSNR